jgi:hypothetical protein
LHALDLIPLDGDADTTLLQFDIVPRKTTLLVERVSSQHNDHQGEQVPELLSVTYLKLKASCYRILVKDHVSGNGCFETISVMIEKSSTLAQLKV